MAFNMETHEQVISHGHTMNKMAKCLSSNKSQCVVIFITNILMRTWETPLSHQVHAPLWKRSVSHGTMRAILIICPQFMGALLPDAFATFLHWNEVTVWMMSCGALVSSPES